MVQLLLPGVKAKPPVFWQKIPKKQAKFHQKFQRFSQEKISEIMQFDIKKRIKGIVNQEL